jgi:microsomal dipeptidase-like Zn-dependent dipeptidase
MHVRRWLLWTAAVALGLTAAAPAGAWAADAPIRYTLANGCYALQSSSGQPVARGDHVRMQATTLGSYLLYRPDRTFLAAQGDGSVAPDQRPSPAADWRVTEAPGRTFTLSPASAPGRVLTVRFVPAQGCAVFPDAELNATGTPRIGAVPYGRVGGIVEGHMHWMTFEYLGGNFHCGRPWHPYGIESALPDCSTIEGPQGTAAPTQNFLNYGNPAQPHDTRGYPQMTAWGHSNLTYEGTYWRWIQRAWLGGLRLMVMSVNENRVLCELEPTHQTNCDEMDTVRRGFQDIRELQRYVDAQAGGPGKGFFQIVTNPYDARRVINQGKMAVVLEVEVSELFGCRGWDQPTCDQAQVDRGLDELYRLGVRSSLLLNKFDNPLTGVRFDSGPVGGLINSANRLSAGSFWSARTCTGPLHDNTIETFTPQGSAALDNILGTLGVQSGTLPTYPPAPHCNTRGLTALGRHVVRSMMDRHMIVNPDHMSHAAVDDTLTLLESRHYSGVISPHGWMDPGNWPRLWKLGGMAFPGHSEAGEYVKEWQKYRPRRTPYFFGWGYGADLGGLSDQPAADGRGSISYPFRSYDGSVTFDRERTGDRTFDYSKDGVAQYGLYADWFADLRRVGGQALAQDMWNGSEAYLEMWERAEGIRAAGCNRARVGVSSKGLAGLRLGSDWQTLLRSAGQPQQRTRAWTWCANGAPNRTAADVAVLNDAGTVDLVGSTARGRSASGFAVGAGAARVIRRTRSIGAGVRVRSAGRVTWVYAVRRGRIRTVAVATRRLARSRTALRRAVRLMLSAKAAQTQREFVPNAAQAAAARTAPTGQTLAGSSNPRLNTALALLCHLQVQAPSS